MAIVGGTCLTAKRDFLLGVHAPNDTYKMALYGSMAMLSPMTEAYTSHGEVTGKGYTRGGNVLTGYQCGIDEDVGILGWGDPVIWPDATITAQGGLIYNASKGNRALAVIDFEKSISSTDGPFRLFMPPVSAKTALIRIF